MKRATTTHLLLGLWLCITLLFPYVTSAENKELSNGEILAREIEQAYKKGVLNKAIFNKLYTRYIRNGKGGMDERVKRYNQAGKKNYVPKPFSIYTVIDSESGVETLYYKTPDKADIFFLELPKEFNTEYLSIKVEMAISGIADLLVSESLLETEFLREQARLLGQKIVNREDIQTRFFSKLKQIIQSKKIEDIEALLENETNTDIKDKAGKSLDIALDTNRKDIKQILQLLVAKGVVVTTENVKKALDKKDHEMLELLIGLVEDINEDVVSLGKKQSILHIAVYKENPFAVDLLLANGADVNKENSEGETPLYVAVKRHRIVDSQKVNKEIIKLLLINGADINREKTKGYPKGLTPIKLVNKEGFSDLADLMRNFGGPSKAEELETLTQTIVKRTFHYRSEIENAIKLALRMEPPPEVPETARQHMRQGIAAFKNARDHRDYKRAENSFSKATLHAPWWADPYFNLGLVQEKLRKYDKATENLELYLMASPRSNDQETVRQKIADLAYAKKKQLEADRHVNRGSDLYGAKDFYGAILANQEAIRLVPGYARAHANLGTTYTALNEFEKAIPELQEAIRLGEDIPYVFTSLAASYYNLDRRQQAISILEEGVLKASFFESGRGFLHEKLGYYYYKDGQNEKALQNFRDALGFSADKAVNREWVQKMITELEQR